MPTFGYALSSEEHAPRDLVRKAREFLDAGFDHVYFHQVGPNQKGFIEFAARELLPRLNRRARSAA